MSNERTAMNTPDTDSSPTDSPQNHQESETETTADSGAVEERELERE